LPKANMNEANCAAEVGALMIRIIPAGIEIKKQ
jgi:hypothetical protein